MERSTLREGTTMGMQRYELEAWLGDDHGLSEEQLTELLHTADEIEEQYPNSDERDDREAALTAAYRLKVEAPEDLVAELAAERTAARIAERKALIALQQVAVTRINNGDATEAGFAQQAGVDRMTVRKWTQERKDRALFNDAIFLLSKKLDMPASDQRQLMDALGIRDTSAQASTLLAALEIGRPFDLPSEQEQMLARAEKRARQVV